LFVGLYRKLREVLCVSKDKTEHNNIKLVGRHKERIIRLSKI
jgi:hypothetical protein